MQIFINGEEIDLYDNEKVAITLQINDLGELSRPNTSYTNSFKIPRTATNTRIFKNLGIVGNTSRVMYELNSVTILENSLPILSNGFAQITDSWPTYYQINIYGSEKTFFEKIKNVTVKDCFPSTVIHYTSSVIKTYAHATGVFCFPVAQYNGETTHSGSLQSSGAIWSRTKVEYTSPVFYASYLFQQIFTYLGYALENPIYADPAYIKLVVPSFKGVSSFNLNYGDMFDIKNCVTEVGADTFIKEIMYRFGLIIQVDEVNKKVKFSRMDTLLGVGSVKNWTDKVVDIKNEKYSISGYAQKNYMTYSGDDEIDENFPYESPANELTGSFGLDVYTYDDEKTVISSTAKKPTIWGSQETNEWSKGRIFFYNYTPMISYWMLDIAENTLDDDGVTVTPKEVPFQFCSLKIIEDVMQIFLSPDGTDDDYNTPYPVFILSKDYLSFQYYIDNHYQNIQALLSSPAVVKVNMLLDVIDINSFDFFNRIYLEQFGSFFYLNKISNWQKNKIVEVELIKIPPISAGGYYASTTEMIGTP